MGWWKKAVVYQIYPNSFNDTTGSGQGDINGIIEKLDYIKLLGTEIIWLTPIYKSPMYDNGYDISDYYAINEEFGTMEDFDRLLQEVHIRGLKLVMDIVVNHTSTEHDWFQGAKKSRDNKYRDYYIWREQPNNWQSKFGGSAWEFNQETGDYYLHLFDISQADLNWENPALRAEIYEMMRFWAKKGVDGFRLDVINLISKNQSFSNDTLENANADGRRFYTDGPRIHEFLQEINREVFSPYNLVTVGEMSSTDLDSCVAYTLPANKELNMTFSFHHLKVDYKDGYKWGMKPFDFMELKSILSKWQIGMQSGGGWNALFWCNHDQPRAVSRFGDDGEYRVLSAKMLATVLHCLQGTPYIYQGEEIGMTNAHFTTIEQYRDVESHNYYKLKSKEGVSVDEIMAILAERSRDNSRTPMQWTAGLNAGFTTRQPWIGVADNFININAEKVVADSTSIFHHYRQLIELRKEYALIVDGDYTDVDFANEQVYAYLRKGKDEALLIMANFYGEQAEGVFAWGEDYTQCEILIRNYDDASIPQKDCKQFRLRPYEAVVYLLKQVHTGR